jgi:hypothetical protein
LAVGQEASCEGPSCNWSTKTPWLLLRTAVNANGVNRGGRATVLQFGESGNDQTGSRLLQFICVLFLQEQLEKVGSLIVNFDYLQAQSLVAYMSYLNLAIENLSRDQLASEFQDLTDWKFSTTHNQDAVLTHVFNQAGECVIRGFQSASMPDRNTRFRA